MDSEDGPRAKGAEDIARDLVASNGTRSLGDGDAGRGGGSSGTAVLLSPWVRAYTPLRSLLWRLLRIFRPLRRPFDFLHQRLVVLWHHLYFHQPAPPPPLDHFKLPTSLPRDDISIWYQPTDIAKMTPTAAIATPVPAHLRPNTTKPTKPQDGPETFIAAVDQHTLSAPQRDGDHTFETPPVKKDPKSHVPDKDVHYRFMEEALDMARLALRTNETPVGCVLVYKGRVIAKGMNATNVTRCGIRHAEYMALGALLSHPPTNMSKPVKDPPSWPEEDIDPTGHYLYPYGQKLHPSPVVDPAITKECTLYVTVEPCVMCASMLRQYGIKKVYYGASNDKFGGTGGVFKVHVNSLPIDSAPQLPKVSRDADGTTAAARDALDGDGGNVEMGFEVEGGWSRDEAVALLRRFYVQENDRSPFPQKKDGRAERLAQLMGKDGAVLPAYLMMDLPVPSPNTGSKSTEIKTESKADTMDGNTKPSREAK